MTTFNPMLIPEDQHKTLECRLASHVIGDQHIIPKCSGSACGHWRADTNPENATYGNGFCGLAGIPSLY